MVARGCAWLLEGDVYGCGGGGFAWLQGTRTAAGGRNTWSPGVCEAAGGHVWLLGGMSWLQEGGMCGCRGWGMRRIRRDTVNGWAVCNLLECILIAIFLTNEEISCRVSITQR